MLRQDGVGISFKAFGGEELPMLYPFLTFANPTIMEEGKLRYTAEDIQRIEETNPRWEVKRGILAAVNNYLSSKNSVSFSLEGVNMMFVSNPEEAHRTNDALLRVFGNVETLKEVLTKTGYTI